jgi:hypothetical protein
MDDKANLMSELSSSKTIENQVGTGRADRDMDKTGYKKPAKRMAT